MRIPRGCGVSNNENIVAILKEALGETVIIAFIGLRFFTCVSTETAEDILRLYLI